MYLVSLIWIRTKADGILYIARDNITDIVNGTVVTVCRLCPHGHWEPTGSCAWPCSPQLSSQSGTPAPRGLHFHRHTLYPHHPDQWRRFRGGGPAFFKWHWRVGIQKWYYGFTLYSTTMINLFVKQRFQNHFCKYTNVLFFLSVRWEAG